MSAIILDNEIVHYEVLGRGRPVFFLHGWVGSWRYWIPSMQVLSSGYRAYAIDFWGFGGTAKEPSRYLLNNQRDLLNYFMFELGIEKIALIGHGLGAVIALMFIA
jgi:pimeloyl-ACP methyl ester carboxylesterase